MSVSRWVLPTTWAWSSMGEVAEVVGGGTPSTADATNFGGDVPWVTPADMASHTGKYIAHGARSITAKGLEASGARWLPSGTVLFSSRAPIGYTAIASHAVTTNQGFKSFIPSKGISADYVYHWLSSAKAIAEELASGTTFLELSGAKAALLPFPTAPTQEQTRIVAKLEELLSDLDAGVAELKAASAKLAQYRRSLLKAAVEGALTAEWRCEHAGEDESETGQALLQRILAERRARWEARQRAKFEQQGKTPPKGWQSQYPEPVAPGTRDLPALPPTWAWCTLDALISDGPQNGLYMPGDRYGRGSPILRIDDYQIGWHRERSSLKCVEADASTCELYSLRAGDLVINRVNSMTHLGKSLRVPESLSDVLFESNMMRARLSEAVSSEFVALYLGSDIGRSRMTEGAKWAVNQASINQQDVRRTPVPLPPRDEQVALVDVLDEQLDAAANQAVAISVVLKQSTAQRQNLLRAAFSGRLVPQDPADEPASALLERIRAARTAKAAKNVATPSRQSKRKRA